MTAHRRFGGLVLAALGLALTGCGPKGESAPADVAQAPAITAPAPAEIASAKPQAIGDCVQTRVASTGPRLEGVPDSGSSIQYENGMSQVEYDVLPGIVHSQAGDDVRLCLVSVPQDCPAGDDRGRIYAATNARTGETWSAPDSQHSCGGA